MDYFTLAWWTGTQSEHKPEPFEAYQLHLESLRGKIPESLLDAEQNAPLHDARLRVLRVDTARQTLEITLDSSGPDGSALYLRLVYTGLSVLEQRADPAAGLPGPHGFGDLGYSEAHFTQGEAEHRLLFSSGIEFRTRFRELLVDIRPRNT